MSAVTLIREAAKSGVWVGLNGGNLALKAAAKPPDVLLAKLKANKAEIVALLRQAACAVRPAGYSDTEWLAAIADAKRLGYSPREDGR
jgi:TubC N-terminal docking domain